jgi:uncharacterized protein YjbI with pentapeptide repeats
MANEEHLARLRRGVKAWNRWRTAHPEIQPDLSQASLYTADLLRANFSHTDLSGAEIWEANLRQANLYGADLLRTNPSRTNLHRANLSRADLHQANLAEADLRRADLSWAELPRANLGNADFSGANLTGADLFRANLYGAIFSETILRGANLSRADLSWAVFYKADLSGANLTEAHLIDTDFEGANLTGCRVYGIAVWNVALVEAKQSDLVISDPWHSVITVDNLEVAQFIHLLLHNEKIRQVIDTITSKAVLILGRFTPERKAVLDAIRNELRRQNYLPILFDFEKPASRDLTESISTLARMARFIIADITEAKSIPQELQRIVPDLPSVPVQPLLQVSAGEYGMFEHFKRYPWVLETYHYESLEEVIDSLPEKVIAPAEVKAKELLGSMKR